MLHIILFILKILRIFLLGLLGLLLVLLLIVLFVPVRYDVFAGNHTAPEITVKVTWLFGGLKAIIGFSEGRFKVKAALFWKTFYETGHPDTEQVEEAVKETTDDISEDIFEAASDVFSDEEISEIITEIPVTKSSSADRTETIPEKKLKASKKQKIKKQESSKENRASEKNSLCQRIFNKLSEVAERIEHFSENIEEKTERFEKKYKQIQRFIEAECTQNSIIFIKRMLHSLLKHIIPKQVSGEIHFGFDKPSTTGKVLGYVCAFYPLYGDNLHVYPEFEKALFEGDLKIKGTLRFYIMVYWLLRAALCKDIHKLIKYIKHLKGEGGNK